MKQITGMVVELKEKTCVIFTRSGEFREVPRPSREVRLGEEIVAKATAAVWWKPLLAAASVFILLWAGFLYSGWSNEAVAYVGLDINPSIELGVNRRLQVCEASGLDAEGRALLQKVALRGLPLDEAITAVLTEAASEQYLNPAGENVILTTITVVKEQSRAILDREQISRCIQGTLNRSGVRAEVAVEEAPAEVRRQAKEAGLSTGKYLQRLRGPEKKGLPVPGGAAGLPQKNAAGREEKEQFKTRELTGSGKEIPKGAPGKEEKNPGKKGPEGSGQKELPKENAGENAQNGRDEIQSSFQSRFPEGKSPPDKRYGNDRKQNGDDDRAVQTDQVKDGKKNVSREMGDLNGFSDRAEQAKAGRKK
ncbi:MAG: anti-sigma factor domain-containing protein [Armatimonadetes bacterium]|nr:anti-sigma factor domain-containing protein [Armatimonadota bacterium]